MHSLTHPFYIFSQGVKTYENGTIQVASRRWRSNKYKRILNRYAILSKKGIKNKEWDNALEPRIAAGCEAYLNSHIGGLRWKISKNYTDSVQSKIIC